MTAENNYFSPEASQELAALGVTYTMCWKIVWDFQLGKGYVEQPAKLIPREQLPAPWERYQNVKYYPAIEKPAGEFGHNH